MRAGPLLFLTLPFALTACGRRATPAPPSLAYSVPNPAVETYARGDTVRMDIDAAGQMLQVEMDASGTFGATFTRDADGVRVSMDVVDFSGRMSQPMQEPMRVDKSEIQGPLVFTLDRKGVVTAVSQPKLTPPADHVFEPLVYMHTFFPRLPGGPVRIGSTWTDTIRFEGRASGGKTKQINVLTYSVSGDTVVAGRSLLRLALQGTSADSTEGTVAGEDMNFSESLTGAVRGWVLWDASRGLMVESYLENDARGTMSVPMAPGPMDVRLRRVSRTTLAHGK